MFFWLYIVQFVFTGLFAAASMNCAKNPGKWDWGIFATLFVLLLCNFVVAGVLA